MPLYEYECQSCGKRFERIQKYSDPPIEICPTCGGPVQKLISSPAFQFKGSGWYVTDYAKKSEDKKGDRLSKERERDTGSSKDVSGASDSSASSAKDSAKDSPKETSKESAPKESTSSPAPASTPSPSKDSGDKKP
jgi:putative FmdB family regulatory protein